MDPFVVLGLPPTMELDEAELEHRYLALSRECHPDHHADADADVQVAILQRSAKINDAYRRLRDPWQRAEALLELSEPGVLERSKQLCPTFLMEAMEVAERVAASGTPQLATLRTELEGEVARYRAAVSDQIERHDWTQAATLLHESRYYRKALSDLEAKTP